MAEPLPETPAGANRPRRRKSRSARPASDKWAKGSLFLGWKGPLDPGGVGFHALHANANAEADAYEPLLYNGDGHLMTVAPTGAGKGIGVIVPNLLTYPGSVIAIDIKGELTQVTARRRREMGQRVVVLDPFSLVTEKGRPSDALNPFDLFKLPNADPESDAEMLAAQFSVDHNFSTDRYWDDTGKGLAAGLIAHLATTGKPEERHPNALRKMLYMDDLDYTIATWLDKGEVKNPLARDEFVAYLSAPSDKTRPCIRTTACTYLKCLGSEVVSRAMEKSTFDLNTLMHGEPVTIYLVIPPEKLESHRAVLRAWVATLLTAVLRRSKLPDLRTLFIVDEAAQLGEMPLLRTAMTLLRGYGLQCWTFWQDLGQLRQLYPDDWTTMVSNSAALQAFGLPRHGTARTAWLEVLGEEALDLPRMPHGEMAISFSDSGIGRYRRANYLIDPLFTGLFDPNKRFEKGKTKGSREM
jgi:type IV secretion system protein VirD4